MLFRVLCLAAVASASQVGNSKLLKLRGGMDLGPVTQCMHCIAASQKVSSQRFPAQHFGRQVRQMQLLHVRQWLLRWPAGNEKNGALHRLHVKEQRPLWKRASPF